MKFEYEKPDLEELELVLEGSALLGDSISGDIDNSSEIGSEGDIA